MAPKSNHSFAAKLAAFMLNGVDHHIRCKKEGGFSSSAQETIGLLPFLHLNITRKQFHDIVAESEGNMTRALKVVCNGAKLNSVLKSVNFNCDAQSKKASHVLAERIVDTIEVGYESRKNGKKRARELATLMRLQNKADIIPASSIKWAEGLRGSTEVTLS